jgi:hypothetical protein
MVLFGMSGLEGSGFATRDINFYGNGEQNWRPHENVLLTVRDKCV